MIKVEKTRLDGVLKIQQDYFEDFRGFYRELYHKDIYKKLLNFYIRDKLININSNLEILCLFKIQKYWEGKF